MVRIIMDCFGGDRSPDANVEGSLLALRAHDDLELIFTGDETVLRQKMDEYGYSDAERARVTVVHAPEVVGCDEKPTDVIRMKKESSLMKGIRLLREDESIAGLVSAGSSGALVAAALLRIGRIPGVIRPAFCPVLPTMAGGVVGVCDSGANVDIQPDMLPQFALMASLYMEQVYGVEQPRVALLNIGLEEEKGDELRKAAFPLLQATPGLNFVGNMESRDFLSGSYDLVVCDGFSGNVLLKTTEGTALELLKKIKKDIFSRVSYKIGAFFMRKMFAEEKEMMNYQNYGGSPLLGISRIIIKAHGSAKAVCIEKSIDQAYRMAKADLNEKTYEALTRAGYQK